MVLMILASFSFAPIITSCVISLIYSFYLFVAYEEAGFQHAQEFENRFWTIFAVLLSTALAFCQDSPVKFGLKYPSLGFLSVCIAGYVAHMWNRYMHRKSISKAQDNSLLLRRRLSNIKKRRNSINLSSSTTSAISPQDSGCVQELGSMQSLERLRSLGIPVEEHLKQIHASLEEIDQLLVPSTINNVINHQHVLNKEREIISQFEECDARALNYLISHVKLGLIFYKIKDHRTLSGAHRTQLINLLAVERLPVLTVMSRVIVLHSLQLLKLRANPRAEMWVRNILVNTHLTALSELKTLTDAKGDYFCMTKLIYDDIRSDAVRLDILKHIRKEVAIAAYRQQQKRIIRSDPVSAAHRHRHRQQFRKVLSDVDDTLYCSGGSYPAGVDKRFNRKTVYPGVLAFYRELDLGIAGSREEAVYKKQQMQMYNQSSDYDESLYEYDDNDDYYDDDERVGNLVFLSARPHVYKDMSEKMNYAKFQKLRARKDDGRKGLHTMPSLLAGDLASGGNYLVTNNFEPLARKKFENFSRYASIYPEYQHVFVCDNGQGDVRAGELMFDSFPYEFEALFVQEVLQDITKTHGYAPYRWRQKEFRPYFFKTYPQAALQAATRQPPMIRLSGLRRICQDAVKDFAQIKQWPSEQAKHDQRQELNQAVWKANLFLENNSIKKLAPVDLIHVEDQNQWSIGQLVRTPYGIARIVEYTDPDWDLYTVELDWRPLDVQVRDYETTQQDKSDRGDDQAIGDGASERKGSNCEQGLATVIELELEEDEPEEECAQRTQLPAEETVTTTAARQGKENEVIESSPSTSPKQQCGESSAERQPESSTAMRTATPKRNNRSSKTRVKPYQRLACCDDDVMKIDETQGLSISSELDQELNINNDVSNNNGQNHRRVLASVCGRYISKFTPPQLPNFEENSKQQRSLLAFLSPTTEPRFKEGDLCDTCYGRAIVLEYRPPEENEDEGESEQGQQKGGIVVVDMVGWKAKAYLQEHTLTVLPPKSLFKSILRPFSGSSNGDAEHQNQSLKQLEFPYAEGTRIQTPFGQGTVVRPLPAPSAQSTAADTIGIRLDSWILASDNRGNGQYPMLYCTEENARSWINRKSEDSGLFSALGNLVTTLLPQPQKSATKKLQQQVLQPKVEEQYYKIAAAVTTDYGDGVVQNFRDSDGFYRIALKQWDATAFLRKDDIRYRIAKNCQEGYPVLIRMGKNHLSGTLQEVVPTSGKFPPSFSEVKHFLRI